jgi:hypothetical protein
MQGLAKQEKTWNEKKLCTFDLLKELKTSEQKHLNNMVAL